MQKLDKVPITAYKTFPPIWVYQVLTYHEGQFMTFWYVFNLN